MYSDSRTFRYGIDERAPNRGANVPPKRNEIDRESVTNVCSTDVTSRLGIRVSTRERGDSSKTILYVYLFRSCIIAGVKINGALVRNRTELAETVDDELDVDGREEH